MFGNKQHVEDQDGLKLNTGVSPEIPAPRGKKSKMLFPITSLTFIPNSLFD